LRELTVPISRHHNRAINVLTFSPCAHDKWVVHRKTHDGVDTLGRELFRTQDVARKVKIRTRWGEGTRNREENNLAVTEKFRRLHMCGTLVSKDHDLDVWDLLTN
jgi:hypothetical protein